MNLTLLTPEDVHAFQQRFPVARAWLEARTLRREYQALKKQTARLTPYESQRLSELEKLYHD